MNIKLTKDTDVFLKICDKVRETRDCRIKTNLLFNIMLSGIYADKTKTYITYDKQKLAGCALLTLQKDMTDSQTLFVVYMFIDRHYPELSGEYMEFIENKASEWKATKISFTTHRNPKAVIRKYGKHGYRHRCSVIEKILDKEVI